MKKENHNYNHHATFNKIILNYLQMFPLIRHLDFKWDNFIMNFLNAQTYFIDPSDTVTSFDCFISSKIKKKIIELLKKKLHL